MNLNMQFDNDELNSSTDFTPVPAGNYVAQIINSEIKENKTGGNRLSLTFQILDGDYANRLIFQNINLQHANPEVGRIGRQQLAQICHAIGRTGVGDSSDLHNQPMQIRVRIKEDKTGQYEPQNEIKGYAALQGITPVASTRSATTPAQTTRPAQSTTQSAAPWARK